MSRRVLITGASTGIGKACAIAFEKASWEVFATARDPATLADLPERVKRLKLDVTKASDREAAGVAVGGRLECLVNNAGIGVVGPLEEVPEAALRRLYDVNLIAPTLLIQGLLPALRASQGKVVGISSLAAFFPIPLSAVYGSSKAAVDGLYGALREEVRPHGVKVCVVQPGGFRTRFADNTSLHGGAKGSPYEQQMRGFLAGRSRIMERNGRDPMIVAKRVLRLAQMADPPFSTRVGPDSVAAWAFKRLLPERVFRGLARAVTQRLLKDDVP
jgi:NAD(P)-dependent dehydrogenase (short-subunit alcohol dehydrogenase family)